MEAPPQQSVKDLRKWLNNFEKQNRDHFEKGLMPQKDKQTHCEDISPPRCSSKYGCGNIVPSATSSTSSSTSSGPFTTPPRPVSRDYSSPSSNEQQVASPSHRRHNATLIGSNKCNSSGKVLSPNSTSGISSSTSGDELRRIVLGVNEEDGDDDESFHSSDFGKMGFADEWPQLPLSPVPNVSTLKVTSPEEADSHWQSLVLEQQLSDEASSNADDDDAVDSPIPQPRSIRNRKKKHGLRLKFPFFSPRTGHHKIVEMGPVEEQVGGVLSKCSIALDPDVTPKMSGHKEIQKPIDIEEEEESVDLCSSSQDEGGRSESSKGAGSNQGVFVDMGDVFAQELARSDKKVEVITTAPPSVTETVSRFGGRVQPSSVQRKREALEQKWAQEKQPAHTKKVEWQSKNGVYAKKVTLVTHK